MARKTPVNGAVVRAWLVSQGEQVGSRGRFSQAQIDAFQAANPGKVYTVGHVEPVEIKGTRISDAGRKTPVRVKATIGDVRAWAQSPEGAAALGNVKVGDKGRISAPVMAAFAARPKA